MLLSFQTETGSTCFTTGLGSGALAQAPSPKAKITISNCFISINSLQADFTVKSFSFYQKIQLKSRSNTKVT
ncbi:hypothetical protein TUM4636_21820 [Shewanella glacialipiscicola]|nr:hypothetical protein TUM4636_21820 [Shewanella glacialipiscicola]